MVTILEIGTFTMIFCPLLKTFENLVKMKQLSVRGCGVAHKMFVVKVKLGLAQRGKTI